ncbi:uncharacterized protein LOC141856016 [Brevipalpus obovatus]|uniref:uncharacterized protein LOC141856016 n=1 Tax=Brevipalpus obovatus TaxID=246614 RepID=UPI003D9DEB94
MQFSTFPPLTLVLILSTVNEALSGPVAILISSRVNVKNAATSDGSKNLDTPQFDQNNQESIIAYEEDKTVQVQDGDVGFDQLPRLNLHGNPEMKEAVKMFSQGLMEVARFFDEL